MEFNTPIKPIDLGSINDKHIGVSIMVKDGRSLEEDFDFSQLDFTWELVYCQGKNIMIQASFSNPDLISPTLNQEDFIQIDFKRSNNGTTIFEAESEEFSPLESLQAQIAVIK